MRDIIHRLVDTITPFDPLEEEHITYAKRWIASGAEIFRIEKPAKPNVHLVSYFVVVDPIHNKCLLVDHKKAKRWLPAGGHVEPNEHPKETVRREVLEELGIEAEFLFESPLFLTVSPTLGDASPHVDVSFWYVLKGNSQDILKYDEDEFHKIQWFDWTEIPFEQADPHMQRFIDKVLNKLTTLHSYETSADQYERETASLHPHEHSQKFMQLLPRQGNILDIGCGPGRDAKVFSENGFDVIGVDFSPKMIGLAKQNAPKAVFQVMDIESLDFPDASFDGIWASCSLLHLTKKSLPVALSQIYRLLKPKGILYLSFKLGTEELLQADKRYGGIEKFWSFYETHELTDLLTQTNFEIFDIQKCDQKSDYQTHSIINLFARKQDLL